MKASTRKSEKCELKYMHTSMLAVADGILLITGPQTTKIQKKKKWSRRGEQAMNVSLGKKNGVDPMSVSGKNQEGTFSCFFSCFFSRLTLEIALSFCSDEDGNSEGVEVISKHQHYFHAEHKRQQRRRRRRQQRHATTHRSGKASPADPTPIP